jgi:putative AdoMet-dependent methyltransferase
VLFFGIYLRVLRVLCVKFSHKAANMKSAEWYFNEFDQVGIDYGDSAKVEEYDKKMSRFRNYKEEANKILDSIEIRSDHTILEIGIGTGHFAIEASKRCKKVYAVDVSKTMLGYAEKIARENNRNNIEWQCSGFLSFDFPGIGFDHIITEAAFHHLPDFWKIIALDRIFKALHNRGKFFLGDVIFSCEHTNIESTVEDWIHYMNGIDAEFRSEAIIHIRKEYSTFSWIVEGMLDRVGFKYQKLAESNNFIEYLCTKGDPHVGP